jgi:hypothetical protein
LNYIYKYLPILFISLNITHICSAQSVYFVAPNGNDSTGSGSASAPWATINKATSSVPDDGSTILVRPGTYVGRTLIYNRKFKRILSIRSEVPYQAKLRTANEVVVMISYSTNIDIAGFDIAKTNPATTAPLAVKIAGGENIALRNNFIHESFNNDLLKINEGAKNILVTGNVFRNQAGTSGQHIDVNGCLNVSVHENIFFNDAAAAGISQSVMNTSHGFIVVKNSDGLAESRRTRITSNLFLNYQGSTGSNFILVGEDGAPYHEAQELAIENNVMLGNSATKMRAPLGVKGGRDILFRNNTVVGDLPSSAFALRSNQEGSNPQNRDIKLLNNIWSNPIGTLLRFSDGTPSESIGIELDNNLYWNAGIAIPSSSNVLNTFLDVRGVVANPSFPLHAGLVLPNWQGSEFPSGTKTIRAEFERLVRAYGRPTASNAVAGRSLLDQSPETDILGAQRARSADLGAFETNATTPALRLALFRPRIMGGETLSLNLIALPANKSGTVFLSSSNPAIASVPASVSLPSGGESVDFAIATSAVTSATNVTITATYAGSTNSATLTVAPQGVVTVNALTPKPKAGFSNHRIMVEGPAATPTEIKLESSRPDLVSFPTTAVVAPGKSFAGFQLLCQPISGATAVTIRASYGRTKAETTIEIQPVDGSRPAASTLSSITLANTSVVGPAAVGARVSLTAPAPTGGAVITLATTSSALVSLPATIVVPAGANSVDVTLQALATASLNTATISASYSGAATSALLTVQPIASSGPKLEVDDFNDGTRDTAKWLLGVLTDGVAPDTAVTVAEVGGTLKITPRTEVAGWHYNGYISQQTYSFTGSKAEVNLVQATNTASSADSTFGVGVDSKNWYRFVVENGRLRFDWSVNGTRNLSKWIAYNPAIHKLLRIAHDKTTDTVSWETSDGTTWTRQSTINRSFSLEAVKFELGAGSYKAEASPGATAFDNFRFIPATK